MIRLFQNENNVSRRMIWFFVAFVVERNLRAFFPAGLDIDREDSFFWAVDS